MNTIHYITFYLKLRSSNGCAETKNRMPSEALASFFANALTLKGSGSWFSEIVNSPPSTCSMFEKLFLKKFIVCNEIEFTIHFSHVCPLIRNNFLWIKQFSRKWRGDSPLPRSGKVHFSQNSFFLEFWAKHSKIRPWSSVLKINFLGNYF